MTVPIQRYVLGGVAIVTLIALAHCHGVGVGKVEEKLRASELAIRAQDSVTKLATSEVSAAKVKVVALETTHAAIRQKVRIVHDSVIVSSGVNDSLPDEHTYVDSTLANLIRSSDSLKVAHKESLAKQDILIASLRTDIRLRDVRIDILESKKSPRLGFRSGVVVGAGIIIGALVLAR